MSSVSMVRGRSRERSRSSDILERSSRESSYSWRKHFESSLKEDEDKTKENVPCKPLEESGKSENKHKIKRRLSLISECFNQQSPSMNILKIKLEGESRLQSTKTKNIQTKAPNSPIILEANTKPIFNLNEIEKSTCSVDVQVKREIFEGKVEGSENKTRGKRYNVQAPALEPQTRSKGSRENWNAIRDRHCPLTANLVNANRGESLKSSILVSNKKISFNNIKFSKQSSQEASGKQTKIGEISSTKEFEDRATAILQEMRKQRRTLQMEYVAKVTLPTTKKATGWRDKLNHSDNNNIRKEEARVVHIGPKAEPTQITGSIKNIGSKVQKTENSDVAGLKNKFSNPLDFILMKEEFVKKNPPPKKSFAKERSVESDSEGEMSMASVMKSLKKIVKAINPKREFRTDVSEKERKDKRKDQDTENNQKTIREKILQNSKTNCSTSSWDERMKKYHGANLVPYNRHASRWNSCQDLLTMEVDKKSVRERIQHRVLSSVHHGEESNLEDNFVYCDTKDYTIKGKTSIKVSKYKLPKIVIQKELTPVFECVAFTKRELPDIIAHFTKDKEKIKKKPVHIKPSIHGLTDSKTDRYIFALVTRSDALWETVKPINVAVKKKTELFAPKSTPIIAGRAKVIIEGLSIATITSPGTSGTTAYCEQHKWDSMKGCALFSVVGEFKNNFPMGKENKLLVINMPFEASLGDDIAKVDHVFTKCERKPQSQLVQDVISYSTGSLSRISFHYPPTFTYYDVVLTIIRFLRTKKERDKYMYKEKEVIASVIEGKSGDRRESNSGDIGYLSYGTV